MTSKEIILNDIINHLDLLINNEPIGMELSTYIECLKDDILFLFKSLKKEKPTLTEDEKAILRNIPKEYKWIGRDENGDLVLYEELYYGLVTKLFNHLFNFIKWTDEKPYLIEDLLKEQEDDD